MYWILMKRKKRLWTCGLESFCFFFFFVAFFDGVWTMSNAITSYPTEKSYYKNIKIGIDKPLQPNPHRENVGIFRKMRFYNYCSVELKYFQRLKCYIYLIYVRFTATPTFSSNVFLSQFNTLRSAYDIFTTGLGCKQPSYCP